MKRHIFILIVALFLFFPFYANANTISPVNMYLSASAPIGKVSLDGGKPILVYLDYELTTNTTLLDSKEVFCVEDAKGILGWSNYSLIPLNEIDPSNNMAKYQAAADIAEAYYNSSEDDKAAAQIAIWETVFDWGNSEDLSSGNFQYYASSGNQDYTDKVNDILGRQFANTNNWWLAVSPVLSGTGTSFTEGEDGQNYLVRMAPAPEPATMFLFGTGLLGLAGFTRKKFGKKA